MIYVIGDSHVSLFSGDRTHVEILFYPNTYDSNPPKYKIIRLNSMVSAYAINIEKINDVLSEFTLTPEDYIIFSFGEIDVRYYISKDIVNGIDPNLTITASLKSYEQLLHDIKIKHTNVIVFSPIPQFIEEQQLDDKTGFLSRKVRDEYTVIYNEKLNEICKKENVIFIDLRPYVLKDGVPNEEYYLPDGVHLINECLSFFEKELQNIIGEKT